MRSLIGDCKRDNDVGLVGAMAQVAPEATAFAHRKRGIMINAAGLYERIEKTDAQERWVERYKRRYDPTNLFYLNQNVWQEFVSTSARSSR